MSDQPRRDLTLLGIGVFLALGATSVWIANRIAQTPSGGKAVAPTLGYVGRDACLGCHAAEGELWRDSHHDRAMEVATDDTVLGDFDDASLTHFGVTSTFTRRDGSFIVRTEGPDGTLQDYPVTHTFGVEPLQQYLVEFPGGRRQALSVAWDDRPSTQGGQRWFDLHPDERIEPDDELHWTGRSGNWNFMCAACHSTNLVRGYDAHVDEYDTTWSEIDVSCEACHGPGSRHVEWARAVAAGTGEAGVPDYGLLVRLKEPGGWVMDMQTGTATRTTPRTSRAQVNACAACHSRRVEIHATHPPAEPFLDGYRPRLIEPPLYHVDGQILDEVYVYGSFLQSRMYEQGVTCSDCHDPHSLRLRAEGNALCAQCHLPDKFDTPKHHFHQVGSEAAQCVSCHMPSRDYMVVDPRRDHSFRVPRPDLSVATGTPNACTGCHADQTAAWAAVHAAEWWGPDRRRERHVGEAIHATLAGDPAGGDLLAELAVMPEQSAFARASAMMHLRSAPGSKTLETLEVGLRDPDPVVRLGAVEGLVGATDAERLRLATPLLNDDTRAVRAAAARVLAPVAGATPGGLGGLAGFDAAAAEYVEAELASAERPESHMNLGNFHLAMGDFAAAETAYRKALSLDAAFVPALVNLSDLLRVLGRDAEGLVLLDEALKAAPRNAAVHHARGLLLVRQLGAGKALASLRQAAGLAPDNARFAYVHAVALHALGRRDAAITELERVLQVHPNDADILEALVAYHREAGSTAAAEAYEQRLAGVSRRPGTSR